jgi:putative glutamine amidotransferase
MKELQATNYKSNSTLRNSKLFSTVNPFPFLIYFQIQNAKLNFPLLLLLLLALSSCNIQEKELKPVTIAISKGSPENGYGNYGRWITAIDSTVDWVDMYHIGIDSALSLITNCDGLILSGGPDVFPGRYGQPEDTAGCGTIDYYRDTLEYALIEYALENDLPVLGICRGQQILNVYFGGSLIVDIPSEVDSEVLHRCSDWKNCYHSITVEPDSWFSEITATVEGDVTTNHHQAIKELAPRLKAVAYAPDSIIEAVEYRDKAGKPFLIAVQWHPERMEEGDPLSWPIGKAFLDAAKGLSE